LEKLDGRAWTGYIWFRLRKSSSG